METWKLFKNGSFENWNFEELFEDGIFKNKYNNNNNNNNNNNENNENNNK